MAEFQTVARASEMAPGEMKLVDVDGEEVVIAVPRQRLLDRLS